MGQLIDKTVLQKELSKLPSEMGFVRKSDVMQILDRQKCAYDVDKIIKQIKMIAIPVIGTVALSDAVKIVKAGGTCQ